MGVCLKGGGGALKARQLAAKLDSNLEDSLPLIAGTQGLDFVVFEPMVEVIGPAIISIAIFNFFCLTAEIQPP